LRSNFSKETSQMSLSNQLELHKYSTLGATFSAAGLTGNQLRLVDFDGLAREITNVKIGRDFVLGVLEDGQTKLYIRKNFLRSLEFQVSESEDSAELQWSRKALGEQLASEGFPARAQLRYAEPVGSRQAFLALGCIRSLLMTDAHQSPLIPVAAISYLELAVDKYQSDRQ